MTPSSPFFKQGNMLELGSYKGDFTKRLVSLFDDLTCVEASDEAILEAEKTLGSEITYINSLFERATLPNRYNNIILTHVLEHLDDPVSVLKKINDDWLADDGRFLPCLPKCKCTFETVCSKNGFNIS